jgi:hypothetical protein
MKYLNDVIVRIFSIGPDPEGDQDVVVVLPQAGDRLLPVEPLLIPEIRNYLFF